MAFSSAFFSFASGELAFIEDTNAITTAAIAVIAATIKVTCHNAIEAAVPAAVAVVPKAVALTYAVPKAGTIDISAGTNIPTVVIKAIILSPVLASSSFKVLNKLVTEVITIPKLIIAEAA